jgi:hypothetical protein
MNFLTLILNRVHYFFARKAMEEVSIHVSVSVLTLLVLLTAYFIFGFAVFGSQARQLPGGKLEITVVFFLIHNCLWYYAKGRKVEIMQSDIPNAGRKNILVVLLFVMYFALYVYLANVNRAKIFKQRRLENTEHPKQNSLESRIRRWYNGE